jgi:predicted nucleotidyltransferase
MILKMNKKIKNKIRSVLENDRNIIVAVLFGSAAGNKTRYGSDIDIAIYFNSEPELNEIGELNLKLEEAAGANVDLVQLNNLDKLNPVLAYTVLSEGILIVNKDNSVFNEYKKSVLIRYLDFKPMNEIINKSFSERLSNNRYAVFEK